MIIGFTGTRSGMTDEQRDVVERILEEKDPELVVHGDCLGADTDFHQICLNNWVIRIRPCSHPSRAWNEGYDHSEPIKGPLDRNKDIVADADLLIATPHSFEEVRRSGTWHTIRHARKTGVNRIIVWPDGSLTIEKNEV